MNTLANDIVELSVNGAKIRRVNGTSKFSVQISTTHVERWKVYDVPTQGFLTSGELTKMGVVGHHADPLKTFDARKAMTLEDAIALARTPGLRFILFGDEAAISPVLAR